MSKDTVSRQVNVYIQSGEAQKALDLLIAKEKILKDQLAATADPTAIHKLTTALSQLSEPIDRATKKVNGELKPSLKDLQGSFDLLRRAIANFKGSDADLHTLKMAMIDVKNQMNDARTGAEKLQKSLSQKVGTGLTDFLSGAGIGIGIASFEKAGAVVADFFSGAMQEAEDAARAVANLRATLEAGGSADAFDRIAERAQRMADKFKFIDNDDVTNVFSRLITYGKLTEGQMNSLIPVIIDFYSKQKLAGDTAITLSDATEKVIKGLEGSAGGFRQYGLNLSEAHTTSERAAAIIDQLGAKVEGAAAAFGESLPGQVDIANQHIKDLQEEIGTGLLPLWTKIKLGAMEAFAATITAARNFSDDMEVWREDLFDLFKSKDEIYARNLKRGEEQMTALAKSRAATLADEFTTKPIEAQIKQRDIEIQQMKEAIVLREKLPHDPKNLSAEWIKANWEATAHEANARALQAQIANANKKLGVVTDDKGETAEEKKREKIAAAQVQQFADYIQKLNEFNAHINGINLSQIDREINDNEKKYDALRFTFKRSLDGKKLTQDQYNKLMVEADRLEFDERNQLIEKWAKESIDKERKAADKKLADRKAIDDKMIAAAIAGQQRLAAAIAAMAKDDIEERKAKHELDIITKTGKEKLQAQLDLIELEKQQAIAAAGDKTNQIKLIEAKADKQIRDAKIDSLIKTYEDHAKYARAILPGVQAVFDIMSQSENNALDKERGANEQKKELFKRQLDSKLLTQSEYQKKVDALDEELRKKEHAIKVKQFNRDKVMKLAEAAINLPVAILSALKTGPIFAAIVGAIGAIQIAAIAAAKPPAYVRGGYVDGAGVADGPRHGATYGKAGISLVRRDTGREVGEMEGGEPIMILSRNLYRNNRSLVDSLMFSSKYLNGAPVRAPWMGDGGPSMNYGAIARAIGGHPSFARGGILTSAADNSLAVVQPGFNDEQFAVLVGILSRETRARVALTDINTQSERYNTIINAATAKK